MTKSRKNSPKIGLEQIEKSYNLNIYLKAPFLSFLLDVAKTKIDPWIKYSSQLFNVKSMKSEFDRNMRDYKIFRFARAQF